MDEQKRTYALSLDALIDIMDETTDQCLLGRKWLENYAGTIFDSNYTISLICDMHSVNYKLFLEIERILEDPVFYEYEGEPDKKQVLLAPDDAEVIQKLMVSRYYVNDELNRLFVSTVLN